VNHPEFHQFLLAERAHELEVDARRTRARSARRDTRSLVDGVVGLRLCTVHDDPALERLAQLEGRPLSAGRFVVAEVNGVVVAAQPLAGGPPLADPFRPTAQLLPLLRLRARQLEQAASGSYRRIGRLSLYRGRA
jgi:hypothetical protein